MKELHEKLHKRYIELHDRRADGGCKSSCYTSRLGTHKYQDLSCCVFVFGGYCFDDLELDNEECRYVYGSTFEQLEKNVNALFDDVEKGIK